MDLGIGGEPLLRQVKTRSTEGARCRQMLMIHYCYKMDAPLQASHEIEARRWQQSSAASPDTDRIDPFPERNM